MGNSTEQLLGEFLSQDARGDVDLTAGTPRRRSRRAEAVVVVELVAATAAVAAVVATGVPRWDVRRPPAASTALSVQPAVGTSPAGTSGRALDGNTAEDCVETYSPSAVAGRVFAFDGTVTAIGPARSDRSGAPVPLVRVTFRVGTWFRGGAGTTATVDMDQPHIGDADSAVDAYAVGTRLLVSGGLRSGGASVDDTMAWGCGFTRYFDGRTAAEWAVATSNG